MSGTRDSYLALRVANVAAYALTMAANLVVPKLTGLNNAAVSAKFHTVFTPAGYAFSIWGIIFVTNALFALLQLWPCTDSQRVLYFQQIGWWHVLAQLATCVWVVLFSLGTRATVAVSVVPLFAILFCLGKVLSRVGACNVTRRPWVDYIAVDFCFSVWAGWVTVAATVGVAVTCTALGWDGKPWTPQGWSCLLVVVTTVVAGIAAGREHNFLFPLSIAWALYAVAVANSSDDQDNATLATCARAAAGVILGMAIGDAVAHVRGAGKLVQAAAASSQWMRTTSASDVATPLVGAAEKEGIVLA